jgi:hypothetical protein
MNDQIPNHQTAGPNQDHGFDYQPFDIVRVYQDPITCQDFEGHAELIEPIGPDRDGLQKWTVRFTSDPPGDYYARLINTDIDVRRKPK